MPEYLSKEEIKQWRSSLEKITLEEYAARLGKTIEEEKQTNDLVDIVLKDITAPSSTRIDNLSIPKAEKIDTIAKKAFDREHEIARSPFSLAVSEKKSQKNTVKAEKVVAKTDNISAESVNSVKEEVNLILNKALTDREQMVFDYFSKNKNQIVYAKDLAKLLDLPRDYVYKYIKNLRTKIEGDKLQNAENGGYVLSA